jgi:hypothetical protein
MRKPRLVCGTLFFGSVFRRLIRSSAQPSTECVAHAMQGHASTLWPDGVIVGHIIMHADARPSGAARGRDGSIRQEQ